MAKKHFTGYKGKTGARIIAGTLTGGIVALGIWGGSIINKFKNNHETELPSKEPEISDLVQEPSLQTPPNYGEYNPGNTLPELQNPEVPDMAPDVEPVDPSKEFIDVLAKLTNKSNEYIQSVSGGTSNLKVANYSYLTINASTNELCVLAQNEINGKFNNSVITISNATANIYDLFMNSSSATNALNQLLDYTDTSFKLQLKQYIKLSNESEIVARMLQIRLAELQATGLSDSATKAEIAHLEELLEDVSKVKFSVLLNNTQQSELGYNYSFTTVVNTGKYLYSSDHTTESTHSLSTTALKHNIENTLDDMTECKISTVPSASVNQALYVVNKIANNTTKELGDDLTK